MKSRPLTFLFMAVILAAAPANLEAQVRGGQRDRLKVSGWAGGFTSMGGFSQDSSFFQFDDSSGLFDDFAFGGSVRYGFAGGMSAGVEALFSKPSYIRYDRTAGTELGRGTASVYGLLASASLTGTPGNVSFILSGGAGFFSWDVDELDGTNRDIALDFGIGVDYRLSSRLILFGDYTWWWVYHEKDDDVVTNTARLNLLRAGLRVVVL